MVTLRRFTNKGFLIFIFMGLVTGSVACTPFESNLNNLETEYINESATIELNGPISTTSIETPTAVIQSVEFEQSQNNNFVPGCSAFDMQSISLKYAALVKPDINKPNTSLMVGMFSQNDAVVIPSINIQSDLKWSNSGNELAFIEERGDSEIILVVYSNASAQTENVFNFDDLENIDLSNLIVSLTSGWSVDDQWIAAFLVPNGNPKLSSSILINKDGVQVEFVPDAKKFELWSKNENGAYLTSINAQETDDLELYIEDVYTSDIFSKTYPISRSFPSINKYIWSPISDELLVSRTFNDRGLLKIDLQEETFSELTIEAAYTVGLWAENGKWVSLFNEGRVYLANIVDPMPRLVEIIGENEKLIPLHWHPTENILFFRDGSTLKAVDVCAPNEIIEIFSITDVLESKNFSRFSLWVGVN